MIPKLKSNSVNSGLTQFFEKKKEIHNDQFVYSSAIHFVIKYIPIHIVVLFLLIACGEEDKPKVDANIVGINLISSNVDDFKFEKLYIDAENAIVKIIPNIPIPKSYDTLRLKVDIVIADGAELQSPLSNLWFASSDDDINCTVIAENGDFKDWVIQYAGNQLSDAHFELWHEVTGLNDKLYWEPGKNQYTIWATNNLGSSIYNMYGVIKFPEGSGTQVKIKTEETSEIPIMAGSIFTGLFSSDLLASYPTNPEMATIMGVPFGLRPDTMRITYRYKPGEKLIKATPNANGDLSAGFSIQELSGKDECHIYAVLERKADDTVIEVGKAEFSTSNENLRVTTIDIPFVYNTEAIPTQISFVATSSIEGAVYQGAVGSTLIIDDLVFIYE